MSTSAQRIAKALKSSIRNHSQPKGLPETVRNTNETGDTPDVGNRPRNTTLTNRESPMWHELPMHIPVGSDFNTVAGSGNGPKLAGYQASHPFTGATIPVTESQAMVAHPYNYLNNTESAIHNSWKPGDPMDNWTKYLHPKTWGGGFRKMMLNGDKSIFNQFASGGALQGSLAYGIPLMLAGVAAGGGKDKLYGTSGTAKNLGLLGALVGASGGAYSGHLMNKYSAEKLAYRIPGGDMKEDIISKLRSDMSTPPQVTQVLINEVRGLDPAQTAELSHLLMSAGFGAVAAIIAKFIFGSGLTTAALLGIGGATAASNLGRNKDAFGRRTNKGQDMFGQPL